jgi:hypothetical protein
MPQRLSPEQIEHLARKRAGAKMGWYVHACLYVVVNLFFFVSAEYGLGHRQHHWTIFPALGWGVGLALHGISVFVLGKGSSFRERLVARERERLQREQDRW